MGEETNWERVGIDKNIRISGMEHYQRRFTEKDFQSESIKSIVEVMVTRMQSERQGNKANPTCRLKVSKRNKIMEIKFLYTTKSFFNLATNHGFLVQ